MPEYLEWRFGGRRLRIYLSVVALFTYTFATASVGFRSPSFDGTDAEVFQTGGSRV